MPEYLGPADKYKTERSVRLCGIYRARNLFGQLRRALSKQYSNENKKIERKKTMLLNEN